MSALVAERRHPLRKQMLPGSTFAGNALATLTNGGPLYIGAVAYATGYSAYATAGVEPERFGIGPVPAMRKALKIAGLALDDEALLSACRDRERAGRQHLPGLADRDDGIDAADLVEMDAIEVGVVDLGLCLRQSLEHRQRGLVPGAAEVFVDESGARFGREARGPASDARDGAQRAR